MYVEWLSYSSNALLLLFVVLFAPWSYSLCFFSRSERTSHSGHETRAAGRAGVQRTQEEEKSGGNAFFSYDEFPRKGVLYLGTLTYRDLPLVIRNFPVSNTCLAN